MLPNEKVNWHIEGGDKLADSMAIQFKPATAGIKNIYCKINSQKGIRQSIEIKQAAINDVMFTDSNGLKIEKASWGQKINIWIDQKELTGEKLEIELRDSDTFDDDNVAPLISIPAYDGKLIPLNLDSNIKKKAGSQGELYVKAQLRKWLLFVKAKIMLSKLIIHIMKNTISLPRNTITLNKWS